MYIHNIYICRERKRGYKPLTIWDAHPRKHQHQVGKVGDVNRRKLLFELTKWGG